MTETQEVLETQRPKRRALGAFLLGMVPLALAGTAGIAASELLPAPEQTPLAMPAQALPGVEAVVAAQGDIAPGVIATGSVADVDVSDATPQISVSFPPPPEPEPVAQAGSPSQPKSAGAASSGSKSSGSKSSGSKSSGSKSSGSTSYTSFCSSGSAAYSAGSVKGLLTAANKERARLGFGPLSWSGSLASAATSWSQSMAKRDDGTDAKGDALAHNPNRPGAENVAVSYSSAGRSTGTGAALAHGGWMASPGHCQNIMNPAYSSMGAGAATTSNGTTVYTTANYR